jgi:hypothetical protein
MLMRFRNLVLASAALCTTAAFGAELKTVNVPFSFAFKNHICEAGAYTVAVDWTKSTVTLSKIGKPSEPLTWIMLPADNNRTNVSLTFDVEGSGHVLRTVQYGTFATPNLDSQPRQRIEGTETVGE